QRGRRLDRAQPLFRRSALYHPPRLAPKVLLARRRGHRRTGMNKLQIASVLVLGAGKVGSTVADMLAEHQRVRVTLADLTVDPGAASDPLVRLVALDVENTDELDAALRAHPVVINCLPFYLAQR